MPARRTVLALLGALPFARAFAQPLVALEAGGRVLQEVTGQPVRGFSSRDFGREPFDGGRSVLVPEDQAERLLDPVRARLPRGLIAFVGVTNSLALPKPDGVELVVAEGTDQFDILRVAATDGTNFGLGTEDIVDELQKWDRQFGIDIWQAETDAIQFRFVTLPKNMHAFAQRVYAFCPDIVDQGVGDVAALEKLMRQEQGLVLWWD